MNWGSSLLVFGWDELGKNFLDGVGGLIDTVKYLVFNLLYAIWRLIAWIVSGIESVFKKLAGLDVEGNDLVTEIINNGAVQTIFGNLVSFATALMIVFTIVKILQDHYKEKDGGNPYKTCLRTFKGMLMFLFVGIAVSVGLYATGVVFRGLDAATSGGSATIGGQVFKAMAAEANRKERAEEENTIGNRIDYQKWSRVSSGGGLENGKYYLAKMKTAAVTTTADVQEAYERMFPEYNYGIVNQDGTVSPIAPYIKSLATKAEDGSVKDKIKEWFDDTDGEGEGWDEDTKWDDSIGDGSVSSTMGYKNDILRGTTINIKPTISLNWSPIDIIDYNYALKSVDELKQKWDVDIQIMGNGFNLSFSIEWLKYAFLGETQKSMEESSKVFGISMNGSASFQDSKASASFDFEMFHPQMFTDLLASVIVNNAYTWLFKELVERMIPLPLVFGIGPVQIDLVKTFSPIILEGLEKSINKTVGKLVPVATKPDPNNPDELIPIKEKKMVDEDGDGEAETEVEEEVRMAKALHYASSEDTPNGRGIWVNINDKAKGMPITIQRFLFDGNFEELWSQLADNFNDFAGQLENEVASGYDTYSEVEAQMQEIANANQKQVEWMKYMSIVDEYNKKALGKLNTLGDLLGIYYAATNGLGDITSEAVINAINNRLSGEDGFGDPLYEEGNFFDLQEEIEETFVSLVSGYNSTVSSKANVRPTSNYADALITRPVYKPIIEFKLSDKSASNKNAQEIYELFMTENDDARLIVFNMLPDNDGGFSRQIDWSAYGPKYFAKFDTITGSPVVADLYFESNGTLSSTTEGANQPLIKQTQNQMKYYNNQTELKEIGYDRVGLKYLYNGSTEGALRDYTGKDKGITNVTGYWGDKGVSVGGDTYYQAYQGTNATSDSRNFGFNSDSYSVSSLATPVSAPDVYLSSAQSNAGFANSKTQAMKEISTMTDVSEEKSELATEFAKNIITFRRLDSANNETSDEQKDADKKVLESWIETESEVSFTPDQADLFPVPNMPAAEIDNLMAAGPGQRNYLMQTKDGWSQPDNGKFGKYIGFFSYTDVNTVNHLYHVGSLNFVIGYIAMVSALGVYLNFAFGLIKRAVNMAVLYIMSPISIAFYPFDDGSKFNQQFVSPFYKEAISAFAVIVSLNIFILLLSPLQEAVEVVLGNGTIGWLGGWLALVAFTSMLPGIRDTICSVLGASKMESKGIGQMIDDAANSLTSPFKGLKSNTVANAKKNAVKNLANARKTLDGMKELGQVYKDKMHAKKIQNMEAELAKRENKKDKTENDKKFIDKHKAKLEQAKAGRNAAERIDNAIKNGDTSKLSKGEKKRYDKLKNAAEKAVTAQAKKDGKVLTEEEKAQAIKAKMKDKKFQNSVPSVAKFAKGAGRVLGGAVGGAVLAGPVGAIAAALAPAAVKGVGKAGKGLQDLAHNMRGTVFGEALYNHIEKKKNDSNSGEGEWYRWTSESVRKESRKKIYDKYAKEDEERRKPEKYTDEGAGRLTGNVKDGNSVLSDRGYEKAREKARKQVAEEILDEGIKANGNLMTLSEKSFFENIKSKNPKMSNAAAHSLAMDEINKFRDKSGKLNENSLRGHLLNELLNNGGNVAGMTLDSNHAKERIKEAEKNIDPVELAKELHKLAAEGSKDIQLKLDQQINLPKTISDSLVEALGIDNKEDKKKMDDFVEKNRNASREEFQDLLKAEFIGVEGKDGKQINENLIAEAIAANANNFAKLQTLNSDVADLQAAQKAAEYFEKGAQLFTSKVGDLVGPELTKKLQEMYINFYDTNLYSPNENSLGAKYRGIEADSSLTDEQKRSEKIRVTNEMAVEFNQVRQQFLREEGENVLLYNERKKVREETRARQTTNMATTLIDRFEHQIEVETSLPVKQLMMNDHLNEEIFISGDPVEGALKMQKIAHAVKMGDIDEAYSYGASKETVDQLFEWKKTNNPYLDQYQSMGETLSSIFGGLDHDMGGESVMGVKASVTNMIRTGYQDKTAKTCAAIATEAAREEANANERINMFISQLDTMCGGVVWQKYYDAGSIVTPDGKTVRNASEMREALTDLVNQLKTGEVSAESNDIKMFYSALNNISSENPNDINFNTQMEKILNGLAEGTNSNKNSNKSAIYNGKANEWDGVLRENISKIMGG